MFIYLLSRLMFVNVFFLHLLLCICLSFSFEVIVGNKINISTILQNISYESIYYAKRSDVMPGHVVLDFIISNIGKQSIKYFWLHNGIALNLIKPSDRKYDGKDNIYFTEKYDTNITVSLNLKNRAVLPGVYTLTVESGGINKTVNYELNCPPILVLYTKPKRVLQGDTLRLNCNVTANPKPATIIWKFSRISLDKSEISEANKLAVNSLEDLVINENKELKNEYGTNQDTLRFSKLSDEDNGLYRCEASNDNGQDISYILVYVKNRWAALWPFIGIVIEVVVLVTAILLYERYQMRSRSSNTDLPNDQNAVNNEILKANSNPLTSDDVRLRNTTKA